MEGLQVEGTQPAPRWRSVPGAQASAAFGLLSLHLWLSPTCTLWHPQEEDGPQAWGSSCPVVLSWGHQELQPESQLLAAHSSAKKQNSHQQLGQPWALHRHSAGQDIRIIFFH